VNVFLWILQAVLALLSLSGGAYKIFASTRSRRSRGLARLPGADGARSACSRWRVQSCCRSGRHEVDPLLTPVAARHAILSSPPLFGAGSTQTCGSSGALMAAFIVEGSR